MLYICYSINDVFAREAGISLIGFLENNPDYEPEEIFFLDYGINPFNKERLNGIAARYGRHISFLNARPVTTKVKQDFPVLKGWRGTMAPNAKAFVDKIFPDYVERLLFIDADTVVAGSLSWLKHLDMEGKALAVVPENRSCESIRRGKLKLENGSRYYFNSGVLLFNLPVWRSEKCHDMIIDTLKKDIDLEWPDQALLNNALPDRLLQRMPPKFNYMSHNYHPLQERGWLRIGHFYTEGEIDEAIRHPAIIHYLGGWGQARPWYQHCNSRKSDEYFRYKALSPWRDTPLFRPYETIRPPRNFEEKALFWRIKLDRAPLPFPVAYAIQHLYGVFMELRKKVLHRQNPEQARSNT